MVAVFRVLGQLSWFFKEEWQRYTVALVLLLIVSLFDLVSPRLIGMAIDDFQLGELSANRMIFYITLLAAVTIASYGMTYVWMSKLFGGAFVVERSCARGLWVIYLKWIRPFTKDVKPEI